MAETIDQIERIERLIKEVKLSLTKYQNKVLRLLLGDENEHAGE